MARRGRKRVVLQHVLWKWKDCCVKAMEYGGKRGVSEEKLQLQPWSKLYELIISPSFPLGSLLPGRLVDSISLPSGPRLILFSYFPSLFLQYSYSISGIVSSCISAAPRGLTPVWGADLSRAVPIHQTPCLHTQKPGSLGATVHTLTQTFTLGPSSQIPHNRGNKLWPRRQIETVCKNLALSNGGESCL